MTRFLPLAKLGTRTISHLFFPPMCLLCQQRVHAYHTFCPACFGELVFIRSPLEDVLGIPLPYRFMQEDFAPFTKAKQCRKMRAVFIHNEASAKLVHSLKYADKCENAYILAKFMKRFCSEVLEHTDMLVSIPTTKMRLFKRKYNQSIEIARELGKICKLPVNIDALGRRHFLQSSQVALSFWERKRNMNEAFVGGKQLEACKGKRVTLVDDVITTGATMEACAKILRAAGAKEVTAVAFLRAVPELSALLALLQQERGLYRTQLREEG